MPDLNRRYACSQSRCHTRLGERELLEPNIFVLAFELLNVLQYLRQHKIFELGMNVLVVCRAQRYQIARVIVFTILVKVMHCHNISLWATYALFLVVFETSRSILVLLPVSVIRARTKVRVAARMRTTFLMTTVVLWEEYLTARGANFLVVWMLEARCFVLSLGQVGEASLLAELAV